MTMMYIGITQLSSLKMSISVVSFQSKQQLNLVGCHVHLFTNNTDFENGMDKTFWCFLIVCTDLVYNYDSHQDHSVLHDKQ